MAKHGKQTEVKKDIKCYPLDGCLTLMLKTFAIHTEFLNDSQISISRMIHNLLLMHFQDEKVQLKGHTLEQVRERDTYIEARNERELKFVNFDEKWNLMFKTAKQMRKSLITCMFEMQMKKEEVEVVASSEDVIANEIQHKREFKFVYLGLDGFN